MNYQWLDAYLLSKPGTVKDFKAEWNATRYLLCGKMFAMAGGDKNHRPIVTLKCDPLFGQHLRKEYPNIIPGYYMNKEHWNSVYLEGDTPDPILKEMADQSYTLIFSSLSKKMQNEILPSQAAKL